MKKKLMSLALAMVMMLSLVSPAAAVSYEDLTDDEELVVTDIDLRENEYVVSADPLPNEGESVVTSYDNPDGSIEYTYYENAEIIRTYTVIPGSGYYKVRENANVSPMDTDGANEEIVSVGTADEEKPSDYTITETGYRYWGTASYYNSFMNETYTIRCTLNEITDTDGSFSPAAYYAEKGSFIASITAFFLFPTKTPLERAADKIFDEAVQRAFFTKVVSTSGSIIKYLLKKNFSVSATNITYRIKGAGITGNPTGVFESTDGYKSTVAASDGLFNKTTYTGIWTKADWRNPTMGRLMFWDVYGNEYTPTSWNP